MSELQKYSVKPDSSEYPYHWAVVDYRLKVCGRAAEHESALSMAKEMNDEEACQRCDGSGLDPENGTDFRPEPACEKCGGTGEA